jgi:gamma-glutamyltranspeptidase/glutathione hydrolase
VYLGDPDFVDVPVARLINSFYAYGQRASIRMDKATPSSSLPGVDASPAGTQTTHFSVIDDHGNLVAATLTLNFYFGSGLMVPGTGILLNNQMDDFSVKPGVPNGFQLIGAEANAIAPGKRPLSSSTPTFVEGPKGSIIGSPAAPHSEVVILGTLGFLKQERALRHHSPDAPSSSPDAHPTTCTLKRVATFSKKLAQVGQHAGRHPGLQDGKSRPLDPRCRRGMVY